MDEEEEVTDEWDDDSDNRSLFDTGRGREETVRQTVVRQGDDSGGTSKQDFSFLVPISGTKDLSNKSEIVLLPHRQPRDAGCPVAVAWGVWETLAPVVPAEEAGGSTADNFANCVEIKATTRCRSAADSLRL